MILTQFFSFTISIPSRCVFGNAFFLSDKIQLLHLYNLVLLSLKIDFCNHQLLMFLEILFFWIILVINFPYIYTQLFLDCTLEQQLTRRVLTPWFTVDHCVHHSLTQPFSTSLGLLDHLPTVNMFTSSSGNTDNKNHLYLSILFLNHSNYFFYVLSLF